MTSVITLTLNPAVDRTITVPKLELGGLHRLEEQPLMDPGGKGINVAKVLRKFNVPVTATGFLAGALGEKMQQELSVLGIESDFVQVKGEVRTNLKIVDLEKGQTTEINEPGFGVENEESLQLDQHLERDLQEAEYLVLGGSTPQGIDDSIYHKYVELAKKHRVKTILDASGKALEKGIESKPFAIKPNLEELEHLFDRRFENVQEITEASNNLIESGIELVVVSLGKEGALFVTEDAQVLAKPFPIEAKSTVGAGDSMVGAMIYSLLNGFSLEEIAKWATAAGTITASKPGTKVCSLDEVEASKDKVHIDHI
ncbi:1-phosphofructokinase [Halalkalibacillus sediminis]|uniref:Tagatose-6-phosphate kinase n=1 Tax=Halalkalibacillus sediminis TaxID=2018042 RepID=A0A2I0QTP2_9BACI|nr:1-phosphofructokinase [Halalkalibacillus sediminis]PKR77696.1 1-phosphofructokinase [Halalkalibacillus sediminis]